MRSRKPSHPGQPGSYEEALSHFLNQEQNFHSLVRFFLENKNVLRYVYQFLVRFKQYKTFTVFAYPDISMKGVGSLSRILPIPFVFISVISGYANTGKKFSIAFIINFPKKRCRTFCYGTDYKRGCHRGEVLYIMSCTRNHFLFCCNKDAFQNWDFSRSKCQPQQKKLTQHVCKDFPSFS